MIRVTCPDCGASLKAPDEAVGKLSKCPRCKHAVRIPLPEVTEMEAIELDEVPDQKVEVRATEPLPKVHPPERLTAPNRYVICGNKGIIASWFPSSEGWRVKTNTGYVSPLMHRDLLPIEGDFRFVEVQIDSDGVNSRLKGLRIFELAKRYALITLDRGDNDVLKSITSAGTLSREQKNFVRLAIREQLMPEVWASASTVLEFLSNADYHSTEIYEPAE